MIVHTLAVCEDTDPPHGVVVLRGSLEEVRAVAHLLGQDLEITAKPKEPLGDWVSDFEPFQDADGHEYTSDGAIALFHYGRPVAHIQWVTSGDLVYIFDETGAVALEWPVDDEDDPEWTPGDPLLTVARRWCEARLAEQESAELSRKLFGDPKHPQGGSAP